jgi:hypothetical protein
MLRELWYAIEIALMTLGVLVVLGVIDAIMRRWFY